MTVSRTSAGEGPRAPAPPARPAQRPATERFAQKLHPRGKPQKDPRARAEEPAAPPYTAPPPVLPPLLLGERHGGLALEQLRGPRACGKSAAPPPERRAPADVSAAPRLPARTHKLTSTLPEGAHRGAEVRAHAEQGRLHLELVARSSAQAVGLREELSTLQEMLARRGVDAVLTVRREEAPVSAAQAHSGLAGEGRQREHSQREGREEPAPAEARARGPRAESVATREDEELL